MKIVRCIPGYLILYILVFTGCAHHFKLDTDQEIKAYTVSDHSDRLIQKHAPVFITYEAQRNFNRIGRVSLESDQKAGTDIHIDTGQPAVYYMKRSFKTENGSYQNLIYRIHFPAVPYRIIPFHLTAGKNVGLMVVVTIDARGLPVLVTTVHTCGCYLAILPTTHLPEAFLPENWGRGILDVYGEKLPSMLVYDAIPNPAVVVHLRPEVHRVMDIQVKARADIHSVSGGMEVAGLLPTRVLDELTFNGYRTSLYYSDGILKGYVKGSVKPWETLFLSLISLDLFVGTDKKYGDSRQTGNIFYTSLKPWNRTVSDMWNFSTFLKFWGWRL